jgi:ribosomal protein S3AE
MNKQKGNRKWAEKEWLVLAVINYRDDEEESENNLVGNHSLLISRNLEVNYRTQKYLLLSIAQ